MDISKKTVLTGYRPTGPLHLGHYVGSLKNRILMQNQAKKQYIMVADLQALTDNFESPEMVKNNVFEVALDYLSAGLDPAKNIIFIQGQIPELCELAFYYLNLVTVGQLNQNPTVKAEIQQKGFEKSLPVGFFVYPVSQAADITLFKAQIVPVGDDQRPMIEMTNEIVRRFNRIYNTDILLECQAVVPEIGGRVPGIDGRAKMSKSLGNAIYLKDDEKTIKQKVQNMYTDPNHIHVEQPGTVEGNVVFSYLDLFDSNKKELEELKEHYRRGGLGDGLVKKRLLGILLDMLSPIRQRREELSKNRDYVMSVLREGTLKAREVAATTIAQVREAMKINYF